MKKGEADNRRSENKSDFSTIAVENKLSEMVKLINDEIETGLRLQQDANPFVAKIDEQESIGSHICFELAEKKLAIPLTSVMEAGRLQVVRSLPLLPDWLVGITNIRGEIVSVINLTIFLNNKDMYHTEEPSYIVVYNDVIKLAIVIDKIVGTRSLFSLPTEKSKKITDEMAVSGYFAGQAAYNEQDAVKEVTLFDLNSFFSSNRLQNFATT